MGALRSVTPNLVEMPGRRAFDVEAAARNTRLGNPAAKAVLMRVADAVNAEGLAFVGFDTIVRDTELEARTVSRVLQIFALLGLMTHERLTKATIAELRRNGKMWSEEFRVSLPLLGGDLSSRYAEQYAKLAGKKGVAKVTMAEQAGVRSKSKPGRKSVAAADVSATTDTTAATDLDVAATNPPDPLLGGTSKNSLGTLSLAPSAAAKGCFDALDAASATVAETLCRSKLQARNLQLVVRDVMERECQETRQTPAQVQVMMLAHHGWAYAPDATGPRFGLERWFSEGHWLNPPKASREQRYQGWAALGKSVEQQPKLSLETVNECRVKAGLRTVSAEEYARW